MAGPRLGGVSPVNERVPTPDAEKRLMLRGRTSPAVSIGSAENDHRSLTANRLRSRKVDCP